MKKAQMRMMETIMAFVVFSVIIFFVFVFYFNSQERSIQLELSKVNSMNSISVFSNIISSYDLRCFDFSQKNCLDYYKLLAFKKLQTDDKAKLFYVSRFGHSNIELEVFYPKVFNITLFNALPKNYSSSKSLFFPVNIYNDTDGPYGSYYMGVLKITTVVG